MEKVGIIPDRAQAIQFAIESAVENDVILIAGKGARTLSNYWFGSCAFFRPRNCT